MENSTRIDAGGWLTRAKKRLAQDEDASLEAQLLLAHALNQPRAIVLAHPEWTLSTSQVVTLDNMLAQLRQGMPLPYLLGAQEFYGMEFAVNPGVLIPRPETELLVETALDWLREHPDRRTAADVGTGSGCIAAVLAVKFGDLKIVAVDSSRPALETARGNFRRHGVEKRVHLLQSDLLTGLSTQFDLVCANLPYIPSGTLRQLEVARYEPLRALDGGADGLKYISALLADSQRWMAPGGLLLLEIEAGQGEPAVTLAKQFIAQPQLDLMLDLAGKLRLVKIQF